MPKIVPGFCTKRWIHSLGCTIACALTLISSCIPEHDIWSVTNYCHICIYIYIYTVYMYVYIQTPAEIGLAGTEIRVRVDCECALKSGLQNESSGS